MVMGRRVIKRCDLRRMVASVKVISLCHWMWNTRSQPRMPPYSGLLKAKTSQSLPNYDTGPIILGVDVALAGLWALVQLASRRNTCRVQAVRRDTVIVHSASNNWLASVRPGNPQITQPGRAAGGSLLPVLPPSLNACWLCCPALNF